MGKNTKRLLGDLYTAGHTSAFSSLLGQMNGWSSRHDGMSTRVDEAERFGFKLLAFGFMLQILGGGCTALSFAL